MRNSLLTTTVAKTRVGSLHWRKLQIVFTAIIGCIGAGMIVGAWFSIGRVRGEVVVDLAMLGFILPVCVYTVFQARVWQETAASGGDLGRFARWCTRTRLNQGAPIICLFLILSMAQNLNHALQRQPANTASVNEATADDDFDTGMRRECISSGLSSLGAAANGPKGALLQSRVEHYCDCIATRLEAAYSMADLNSLVGDHERTAHDPKVQGAIAACQREATR
jgi:hypothetical protein